MLTRKPKVQNSVIESPYQPTGVVLSTKQMNGATQNSQVPDQKRAVERTNCIWSTDFEYIPVDAVDAVCLKPWTYDLQTANFIFKQQQQQQQTRCSKEWNWVLQHQPALELLPCNSSGAHWNRWLFNPLQNPIATGWCIAILREPPTV